MIRTFSVIGKTFPKNEMQAHLDANTIRISKNNKVKTPNSFFDDIKDRKLLIDRAKIAPLRRAMRNTDHNLAMLTEKQRQKIFDDLSID